MSRVLLGTSKQPLKLVNLLADCVDEYFQENPVGDDDDAQVTRRWGNRREGLLPSPSVSFAAPPSPTGAKCTRGPLLMFVL